MPLFKLIELFLYDNGRVCHIYGTLLEVSRVSLIMVGQPRAEVARLSTWISMPRRNRPRKENVSELKESMNVPTPLDCEVGSCTATPKPRSFTGAEFSLPARRAHCGFRSRWIMSFSWQ